MSILNTNRNVLQIRDLNSAVTHPYASVGKILQAPRHSVATELKLLLVVATFISTVHVTELPVSAAAANVVGCIAVIAILCGGIVRELGSKFDNIWGAMLWFRLACIAYYGIGALLPSFGSEDTVINLRYLFPFTDEDALKSTLINVVAIICVMLGSLLVRTSGGPVPRRPTIPPEIVSIVFLIVGGIAHYGVVVPFLFGFGDGLLHSIVSAAAKMYHAGLMLIVIQGGRHAAVTRAIAAVLFVGELVMATLLFSKTQVMVICIFAVLTIYQLRPSIKRLASGFFFAAVLFALVEPIVATGRAEVLRIGGERQTATLSERLEILDNYFDGRFAGSAGTEAPQASLSRLSYVNAATLVISMYDGGEPGNTLDHLFAALVPRFLWPDKPMMTVGGQDLYTQATGQIGTSISPGVFAEAYWNFGWIGIPLLMLPMGVILQLLHGLMVGFVNQGRWIYLPAILLAISIGTRVDGHFVADMIGPPALAFAAVWLLRMIESLLARRW